MPLEPGARLGPYEIVEPIATGGMGDVYGARDSRLNRDVAIKVLREDFSHDPERRHRFEQEAAATSSLNHPNILSIFDVGEFDSHSYVVMERLEGLTLRDRLREGPLPIQKAVEYGLQIARGLAAAHQRGIAHRDLKPENLFLTRDGHLKILDFGLAKVSLTGDHVETMKISTDPGTVMGTAGYMSPEQVRGKNADHRCDIFSFGVVLYEMCAGRRAFDASTAVETMNLILTADPPPLPPSAPHILDSVIRRCLEKQPDDRFDSARDIAYLLESIGSPRTSSQVRALTAVGPRRNWKRILSYAGTALAGLLLGGAIAYQFRPAAAEPPRMRILTYSGRDSAPAVSPDGKTVAFASDRDGRSRIWLKQLPRGEEVPLTGGPDDSPRYSPDGSTIIFVRSESGTTALYRIASVGGEPRRLVDDVVNADFSPDGKSLVFLRWRAENGRESSVLGVVGIDGAGLRELAELPGTRLDSPRWSPDGSHIAIIGSPQGGYHNMLVIVSADGQQRRRLPVADVNASLSAVSWNGNSEEIIYLQQDAYWGNDRLVKQNVASGRIESVFWPYSSANIDIVEAGSIVFDPRSNRESLQELPTTAGLAAKGKWWARGNSTDRQPLYSPDGQRVVFVSNRGGSADLWQINLESGGVTQITEDPGVEIDPAFSADGKQLVWSSNRSGHFEIYLANADGSDARQVTRDGFDAENGTLTRDRQWIVYASSHPEKAGIWKIHPDSSNAQSLALGPNYNPEVSPDGQHVLYITSLRPEQSVIRVIRTDNGQRVPFEILCDIRRQNVGVIGRARWSPDGSAILFIGQNAQGANGVFRQDFVPGKDTAATRLPVAGFDIDFAASTLAVSPDGSRLMVSYLEQITSLVLAEHVPLGIDRPRSR